MHTPFPAKHCFPPYISDDYATMGNYKYIEIQNTHTMLPNLDFQEDARMKRTDLYSKKKGKVKKALTDHGTYLSDPARNLKHAGHVVKYLKGLKKGTKEYKEGNNIIDLEKKAAIYQAKHKLIGGDLRPDYINTVINEYGDLPKDVYTPILKNTIVERVQELIKSVKKGSKAMFSDDLPMRDFYHSSILEAYGTYLDVLEMKKHDQKFIKNGRKALETLREKHNAMYEKKEQETYKKQAKKYTA